MSEVAALAPPRLRESQRTGRPITAYFKPSDYCNVGCDHCYLPVEVRANKSRMTWTTLDNAIQAVRDLVERQRAPGALILWHGGEPLSLPRDYFEAVCARVRDRLPAAPQAIQTSLVPYRHDWASLVHTYFDGHIGSSIDFSQRTIRGSVERYHALWLDKVAQARADECTVIPGMVPSAGEIGRGQEITEWMHAHGFLAWNIDRYNNYGWDDPARPRNIAHSAFLSEVFDAVMDLAARDIFMRVNTVVSALGGVLYNQPGDRWGGSCSRDFIVINPDGSTSACPDKISFETFGNINDGTDAFATSRKRLDWIRLHMTGHRNDDCPTCPFKTFCRSGCPLTPNAPETEGECSGYNRHLHHVREFADRNPVLVATYLQECG